MHKTLLFFITFISLCAAYSTDAQEYDWAMKAVELERTAFMADSPDVANEAIIAKAICLREAGRYTEASSTLDRVRMYLLSPEQQASIMLEKAICSCLAGDVENTVSVLEQLSASDPELASALAELRAEFDSTHKSKTEGKAITLAFLPPLGHWYTKNYGEGLKSMFLNAAAAGWTVWQCLSGCWISGLLGGGIALNSTFMGNIESSAKLVNEFNETSRREWNEALKRLLQSESNPEL